MKYFLIIITLLFFISCKTNSNFEKKVNCSYYRIEDDNQISWSQRLVNYKFIKTYNEVRFCTQNAFGATKMVYDEFGRWSTAKRMSAKESPLLIWGNIKIEGFDYLINIASSTYEDKYSSLILFDNNGNDLLADNSKDKEKLVEFFIKKINKHLTPKKTSFHKTYTKEVRPDLYNRYYNN